MGDSNLLSRISAIKDKYRYKQGNTAYERIVMLEDIDVDLGLGFITYVDCTGKTNTEYIFSITDDTPQVIFATSADGAAKWSMRVILANAEINTKDFSIRWENKPEYLEMFKTCLNFNIKTKLTRLNYGILVPTRRGIMFIPNKNRSSDYLIIPDQADMIYPMDAADELVSYKGVRWGNPNKIVYLPQDLFGNTNIEDLVVPEGIKFIDNYAFSTNSINRISFPSSIEALGDSVLHCNYELTKATFSPLSERVEPLLIGDSTFFQCGKLEEVVFPPTGSYELGEFTLGALRNLKLIDFGRDCIHIPRHTFVTTGTNGRKAFLNHTNIICPGRLMGELYEALDEARVEDINITFT